jgi:hypothetical protein
MVTAFSFHLKALGLVKNVTFLIKAVYSDVIQSYLGVSECDILF